MKKFFSLVNVLFVLLMIFNTCCSGMHYLNQENLNINPESSAYLCTEGKKIKINTCNHLNSRSRTSYLLSKLNDDAIQNLKGNSQYIPRIEEAIFYLLCTECMDSYLFNSIKNDIDLERREQARYMYEHTVRNNDELHVITCNHDCPNRGRTLEIYSGFLTVLNRPLSLINLEQDDCRDHAIQKFSIYKGYRADENKFKFFKDVFLTRFPLNNSRNKVSVEFPIE